MFKQGRLCQLREDEVLCFVQVHGMMLYEILPMKRLVQNSQVEDAESACKRVDKTKHSSKLHSL